MLDINEIALIAVSLLIAVCLFVGVVLWHRAGDFGKLFERKERVQRKEQDRSPMPGE